MKFGNFTIGYHGCDALVAERLLNEPARFILSNQEYEWLGHGMYFWENNLRRGQDWAFQKYEKRYIRQPAVVGALLDLRNCCDFSDQRYLNLVSAYHDHLKEERSINGKEMPVNFAPRGTLSKDIVARELDCEVIEHMHREMLWLNDFGVPEHFGNSTIPFDSVRGLFIEGEPIFKGSGIHDKSHIQICIRNAACIVGIFLPREGATELSTMELLDEGALFG